MTKSNKTEIKGANIIALQDITARDINIGLKEEQKPEVKKAKEEIAELIAELTQSVALLANKKEFTEVPEIDEEEFEGINFTDLIEAIQERSCILFIGPEIALDENQNSLHELFNKSISAENRKYDEQECFFMPGSEKKLENKAKRYYRGAEGDGFPQHNIIGTKLLKKIAQIPFKLIINLAPDDTLNRILKKYNKKFSEPYFNGNKQKLERNEDGEIDYPIIYNTLGNVVKDGKYIYTHKQLNEYIKQPKNYKFPKEIEMIIMDITHYLFIGFNFNRWHYRLLLFELNLLPDREAFAFKSRPINPEHQTFIHEQFKIDFIDTNFQNFIDSLLQKSKDKNVTKSLDKVFVNSILSEIEEVRIKAVDQDKLEDLTSLQKELISIENKVNQHQQ